MTMNFCSAFTIKSDTRYLALLRQWVESSARIVGSHRFPRRAVMACSLALIEAVDNAIFHAHRRRRSIPIRVSLSVNEGEVVLEVVDRGSGIGHPLLPSPDAMVTHGRGLFLIRSLMAHVENHSRNGCHRMRMIYRL
jgi:anti-sigma regulatory factor (Ser/Thr protein kinase)